MLCIVGGGIAGLYTALLYTDAYPGRPVEVHEASGRWGGHIQTYYGTDYRYETGAGRFNANHRLLTGLIRRFQLTAQPIHGEKRYCGTTPTGVSLDDVWKHPKGTLQERQQMTLGQYIDRWFSKEIRRDLQRAFGYDAEFDKMNAADALRLFQTDFRSGVAYFSLKEGLSALVERMVKTLEERPGVKLVLRSALNRWEWDAERRVFHLHFPSGQRDCTRLFLAVPKKALMEMTWPKTAAVEDALNGVLAVSLHRLYGQMYKDRLYPAARTTLAGIRQYIPVNPAKRIAMISYCDTEAADAWKRQYDADPAACKTALETALTAMEMHCAAQQAKPATKDVKPAKPPAQQATTDAKPAKPPVKLRWVRSYYWPEGVHVWRPGVSSAALRRRLRCPLGTTVPCFIVGESYSALQGWIEGALWSVQDAWRVAERKKYL